MSVFYYGYSVTLQLNTGCHIVCLVASVAPFGAVLNFHLLPRLLLAITAALTAYHWPVQFPVLLLLCQLFVVLCFILFQILSNMSYAFCF